MLARFTVACVALVIVALGGGADSLAAGSSTRPPDLTLHVPRPGQSLASTEPIKHLVAVRWVKFTWNDGERGYRLSTTQKAADAVSLVYTTASVVVPGPALTVQKSVHIGADLLDSTEITLEPGPTVAGSAPIPALVIGLAPVNAALGSNGAAARAVRAVAARSGEVTLT
ncbi:MAG: hypothetical protein HY815_20900, partial [Candidatus Riflebacteria bacterium]|nr:hypothetical protein [Candidatus Riflebacteria bacterium]